MINIYKSFVDDLHSTPKNAPKCDEWNCFIEKIKQLPKHVQ
jgi:hypothetical protein